MRIISRYVFRQGCGALILVVLSLTGIVWIAIALRQLELMTSQGQNVGRFLVMTTLAVPSLVSFIAPIALLISAIYVLLRLSGDSELIVMTAGGMPVWAMLRPLGLLALAVGLVVMAISHVAGPWSQRLLRDFANQVRSDLIAQVIQPWRFTSPEPKLMVHIRDRTPAGDLLGLMMHDARDPKQVVTYLAERGTIMRQGDMAYLRMDKGHIIRRLENEPAPQIIAFDRYAVDLNQLEQRVEQANVLRPRERYTTELLRPDKEDPLYKQAPHRFAAELHERLSTPIYALAFVLIAMAFLGHPQTTRQNRNQAAVAAFASAIGCRILGIASINAAAARPSAIPLMYAVPLSACVLAAAAMYWNAYPRPQSRAAVLLARGTRSLAGLVSSPFRSGPVAALPKVRG